MIDQELSSGYGGYVPIAAYKNNRKNSCPDFSNGSDSFVLFDNYFTGCLNATAISCNTGDRTFPLFLCFHFSIFVN